MARYDRFFDTVFALLFVGLMVANALIIGYISSAVYCGFVLSTLLFVSGAGMAWLVAYYSRLAENEKPQG